MEILNELSKFGCSCKVPHRHQLISPITGIRCLECGEEFSITPSPWHPASEKVPEKLAKSTVLVSLHNGKYVLVPGDYAGGHELHKAWMEIPKNGACGDYHDSDKNTGIKASPIKSRTIVRKASEIFKWLEDHGYVMIPLAWIHPDENNNEYPKFTYTMLRYCGKKPNNEYPWHPEWLMEEEV